MADESTECGVIIDGEQSYLTTSLAGLLDEDGILEVYCPYAARDMTPEEGIQRKVAELHSIFSSHDITQLNKNHRFYFNIQGALHISQRSYCIFAVGTRKGMHWAGVYRDDDFWLKHMKEPLRIFHFESLILEIVDNRLERGMSIRDSVDVKKKVITKNY